MIEKNFKFIDVSNRDYGSFILMTVESLEDGKKYCAKKIDKKPNEDLAVLFINDEISICKNLKHQSIPNLLRIFEDEKNYFLLFEFFLDGSEMFDRLEEKGAMCESTVKGIIRQMIDFLMLLHQNGKI